MVFQDPLSSLDPYYAVGDQIAEVYRVHTKASRRAARARAVRVLDRVGIADAARRSRSRPHEFSGGMRQRALIAMALACEPELLIADEPTTALDVTVQAQILDLLHTLRQETGTGLLLVTHDVGVAAESVDEILVMRHGRAVEHGPVTGVLGAPREPYTRELLGAVPRVDTPRVTERTGHDGPGAGPDTGEGPVGVGDGPDGDARRPAARGARPDDVVLEAVGLRREFGRGKRRFAAVDDASLSVRRGETLGIVGESGSGKTTLGRMLVGLLEPTAACGPPRGARAVRHPPIGADGLPGPGVLPQPPAERGRVHRRSAAGAREPGAVEGRGAHPGAREGTAGARGARRGALRPLPARVQRRAAPACRHRAGARRRAARHRLRRARLRARRHHAGPSGLPARRVAAGTRAGPGVRGTRSRGRAPGQRPGGGDAPRPASSSTVPPTRCTRARGTRTPGSSWPPYRRWTRRSPRGAARSARSCPRTRHDPFEGPGPERRRFP